VTFTGTQPGDGTIRGVVSNVSTQGPRIVGWAQKDRWYVQPTSAEPFTAISCADGSFSLTTNPWTRFVLLLVDEGYQVPAGPSLDRHPSIGDGVVAWAESPGPTEQVTVGTTRFFKKTSNGLATGPGPCPFAATNVVQDAAGVVRLRVAPVGGAWSCAEIYAERPFGYGRYRIKVTGRLDALPRPLVFGDFLFRSLTAEVDLECSEALTGVAGRCQAVVQPFHLPDHIRYFDMPPVSETTHEIVWAPDAVTFRVWQGHTDDPAPGDVLLEWQYTGDYLPAAAGEALLYRVNLWLLGGATPIDGLERDISLSDFSFTALAGADHSPP
jgi:hypothetical protein